MVMSASRALFAGALATFATAGCGSDATRPLASGELPDAIAPVDAGREASRPPVVDGGHEDGGGDGGRDAGDSSVVRDGGEGMADAGVDAVTPIEAGAAVPLGGTFDGASDTYTFAVRSIRATRITVELFAASQGAPSSLELVTTPVPGSDVWTASVSAADVQKAGIGATVYYGYRAWGPNWPYVSGWAPGSSAGFLSAWDSAGNTFDPNKLLIDPYTRELSHDPLTPGYLDASVYSTSMANLAKDSALSASKSIVLPANATGLDTGAKPKGALADDVIYEVHVRGLTENDPATTSCAGTFKAAGAKAAYLAMLGVTAVELLPIMETENDIDDLAMSTANQNYWGYATLADFAPDRRYACDQTPGGPTRELAAMVKSFHDAGIKVFLDAVYNHTAEGGGGSLFSWRGLDNASYYELTADGSAFVDDTGVGANFNVASPLGESLILDSVRYFSGDLGVDGFRFDEAAELGNSCASGCYTFDATSASGLLMQLVSALPGAALIAEPWAVGDGTYQLGHFPAGWSEWNGQFRDGTRTLENKLGVVATPMSALKDQWGGSPSLYATRSPAASINYVVSHDGFTLTDEFACNAPDDTQGWPYGPSSGGAADETQWDQGGVAADQEQAERVAIALLATSAGVPMITGGDEMGRSIKCNDNPYNVDSTGNWLDWAAADPVRTAFVAGAFATRAAHPSLRPSAFRTGTDHNGNGRPDVTWLTSGGAIASGAYLASTSNTFLAYELDATEYGESVAAVMVAYNSNDASVTWTLPSPPAGSSWYVALDTSNAAGKTSYTTAPGSELPVSGPSYGLAERTVALLVAK
jgi:glycogen operon protein